MAHAVTEAGSEVQIRYVSLTGFDRLFEMKEQFGEGCFGSVSTAVSIVEWKMVTIKKLREVLRKPLDQITEFKMLQATKGWPFMPKFIGAFQVNLIGAAFIFEHEDILDLREAWL